MTRIPSAGKTIPATQPAMSDRPMRLYRVEAEWPGGGFSYLLPFPSAVEARAWGMEKAHGRGQVTVEQRGPALGLSQRDLQLASMFGGNPADLPLEPAAWRAAGVL